MVTFAVCSREGTWLSNRILESVIYCDVIYLVSHSAVQTFPCCLSSWMILEPCVSYDLIGCLPPAHKTFTFFILGSKAIGSNNNVFSPDAYFVIQTPHHKDKILGFAGVPCTVQILVKYIDIFICTICRCIIALYQCDVETMKPPSGCLIWSAYHLFTPKWRP